MTPEMIKAMRRDYYDKSFYHMAKYCLGYRDLHPRIHKPMCEALDDDSRRKLICVPRGCFKSSVASIAYPIRRITQNPNIRILLDSELFANSKNFLREIKGHLESNVEFRSHYGDLVGPTWNEGEIIVSTRTKALKEPTIVCSGVEAGKTGMHFDLIIADDLSSYLNTKNPDLAQKTINHFRLYQSLLEPHGTIAIIGTRYSEMDIIGFIIENILEVPNQNIELLKERYGRHSSHTQRHPTTGGS